MRENLTSFKTNQQKYYLFIYIYIYISMKDLQNCIARHVEWMKLNQPAGVVSIWNCARPSHISPVVTNSQFPLLWLLVPFQSWQCYKTETQYRNKKWFYGSENAVLHFLLFFLSVNTVFTSFNISITAPLRIP